MAAVLYERSIARVGVLLLRYVGDDRSERAMAEKCQVGIIEEPRGKKPWSMLLGEKILFAISN